MLLLLCLLILKFRMVRRVYDLTGKKFGRLTVIKKSAKKVKNRNVQWDCVCTCGNHVTEDGYNLRHGKTKSCGCLRNELTRERIKNNQAFQNFMGNSKNLRNSNGVSYASIHKSRKNQSGIVGVSYDEKQHMWFARLMYHGKWVLLKGFYSFDDAVEARRNAEKKYFNR